MTDQEIADMVSQGLSDEQIMAQAGQPKPPGGLAEQSSPLLGMGKMAVGMAGGLVRGALSPPMALGEQAINQIVPPRWQSHNIPWPAAMGGDYPVGNTPMSVAGNALQTAALVAPELRALRPFMAARPIATGAVLGGTYGVGSAQAQNEGLGGQIKAGLGGAAFGTGVGAVAKGASLAFNPQERAALSDRMGKWWFPKEQAEQLGVKRADLGERIATTVGEKTMKLRDMATESSGLRQQSFQLGQDLRAAKKLGAMELDNAEQQLRDSLVSNHVPEIKQNVLNLHKNMTTTYGKILDQAAEGKSWNFQQFKDDVIKPVLEKMEMDRVPETKAIYEKIEGLKLPADMNAKDFKHVRDEVMSMMGSSAKSGSQPAGLNDRWAIEFNKYLGDFIEKQTPELAAANKAYREMATARLRLWGKTRPRTDIEMEGSLAILDKFAKGEPLSASDTAAIKLAEEGNKVIPGVGKGQFSEGAKGAGALYRDLEQTLQIKQDALTAKIANNQKRLRDIQGERSDLKGYDKQLIELRVADKRLKQEQSVLIANSYKLKKYGWIVAGGLATGAGVGKHFLPPLRTMLGGQ
jgi:hypothetical protein